VSLSWEVALLAATGLHAGFQLTVTLVVYPALADVPETSWAAAHAAHSRRITPVVALVYAVALVSCGLAVARAPSGDAVGVWIAAGGTLGAVLTTALVAAPLHGRLARRDDALVTRLLTADRVRCAAALVAVAGAVLVTV
jgi:Domain of unknown function (DUF1772)